MGPSVRCYKAAWRNSKLQPNPEFEKKKMKARGRGLISHIGSGDGTNAGMCKSIVSPPIPVRHPPTLMGIRHKPLNPQSHTRSAITITPSISEHTISDEATLVISQNIVANSFKLYQTNTHSNKCQLLLPRKKMKVKRIRKRRRGRIEK